MLTLGWLYYISEWTVRLAMLVVVPYRRNPASAKVWLLFVFIAPWIGLGMFWLFGSARTSPIRARKLRRFVDRLRSSKDRFVGDDNILHPQLDERLMDAVHVAAKLGHFPILGGNSVELLTDYDGTIDRLIADIDAAQNHAHLLFYIFADDDIGRKVGDALMRAAKRGVKCRLLVDAIGSRPASWRLLPELRQAGVETREMLKVGLFHQKSCRPDLRNHRKIAVIDGQIGYVGSQNIMGSNHIEGLTYEEMMVRVVGPVVLELQAVFCGDWYVETEFMASESHLYPAPKIAGSIACQVLPSGPSYPSQNNQRLIVTLIHSARKKVTVTTPYFIPDDPLLEALQTAVTRGVTVQLIVSRQSDQWLAGHAQRSYYEDLLEAGIQVFSYHKNFLHAKHLTVDDEISFIGSSNMDLRSFVLNAEISLLIFDPGVAHQMHHEVTTYLKNADRLKLEDWRKRGFITKLSEGVARLFSPLL